MALARALMGGCECIKNHRSLLQKSPIKETIFIYIHSQPPMRLPLQVFSKAVMGANMALSVGIWLYGGHIWLV